MEEEKFYSEKEFNAIKSQLEESEKKRLDSEYRSDISAYVKSLNLADDIYENHLADIFIGKNLQFENGELVGSEDIVDDFKSKYPHAFKSVKETASFTAPTSGSAPQPLSGIEIAFLRKNPNIRNF